MSLSRFFKPLKYIILFLIAYILGLFMPILPPFYELEIKNQTTQTLKVYIFTEDRYNILFDIKANQSKNIKIYNSGESAYTISTDINEKNIKKTIYLEKNEKQTLYIYTKNIIIKK